MNRVLTSAIAFGAGIAAYNYVQRNNLMSNRNMKKLQKRITRALF